MVNRSSDGSLAINFSLITSQLTSRSVSGVHSACITGPSLRPSNSQTLPSWWTRATKWRSIRSSTDGACVCPLRANSACVASKASSSARAPARCIGSLSFVASKKLAKNLPGSSGTVSAQFAMACISAIVPQAFDTICRIKYGWLCWALSLVGPERSESAGVSGKSSKTARLGRGTISRSSVEKTSLNPIGAGTPSARENSVRT
mmetsp:Transcript_24293/g.59211  ORF Transcript_24293/g.59211 Transcript_24293/m.59211 type:complete len:204 (-) Transcript_24293:116-727(-)